MTILVLSVNGLLIKASIVCKKMCPPSNPGIGSILIKARLTLIKAIKVKNGKRDELAEFLSSKEIPFGIYYPLGFHEQKAYRNNFNQAYYSWIVIFNICLFNARVFNR